MARSGYKKRRRFKWFLIFTGVIALVWVYVAFNVNPVLKKVAEEEVRSLTTLAVNAAAGDILASTAGYADIITVSKDNEGNINMVEANTPLINSIARKTVIASQEKISQIGERGIEVPIGSLSGITFLSGMGPEIRIKVIPVGAVEMSFTSEFESAGINQTKHKILMTIVSNVSVVMPDSNKRVATSTEVLLCESVIIGKIPDTYLNFELGGSLLDLVP